jgi:hypothetical protein
MLHVIFQVCQIKTKLVVAFSISIRVQYYRLLSAFTLDRFVEADPG